MREQEKIQKAYEKRVHAFDYVFCHYKQFDYNILKSIYYYKARKNGEFKTYNNVIIMFDTETSKKVPDVLTYEHGKSKYETSENHVVAWTLSLRAYNHNICTLYGRKPSTLIETMLRIHECMFGMNTIFYCHNLAYDHYFLRKFMYRLWGNPIHQLNTKSHYPIYIEFANGIILKDSLILAQRKLEKWALDLGVEHQKAVGYWDYDAIMDQSTPLNEKQLKYIENDTLAGVECIDATMITLGKKIHSMPYTATGIPREQVKKRGGLKAHEQFLKSCLNYDQYIIATMCYHGGYTHGNRHYVNTTINAEILKIFHDDYVRAYDFSSSYPYTMLAFKMPCEKFSSYKNCSGQYILDCMENYAFMFKFIAINIKLRSDFEPMPALQFSKCTKTINAIQDNGRILCANYVEIWLTEYDLSVIMDQYVFEKHLCCNVQFARKDYLPRWFSDYIYECFKDKCELKYGTDKVLYSIAKAKVNSLYGLCCMKAIRDNIIENYETGEYEEQPLDDPRAEYEKFCEKRSTILKYDIGVFVTSIAFYNVHRLAKCCLPLYMDTDSCYGVQWDMDKLNAYNEECKERLLKNGYGPVIIDDHEFWLGVATHDPEQDVYSEFRYMGAKRYCGRHANNNELSITVAGVPKKTGATCLSSIDDFHKGFIFSGLQTGKKTHVYFNKEEIYIDERGNETGDSISLIPCDYELDTINTYDWEKLFSTEIEVQIYDE